MSYEPVAKRTRLSVSRSQTEGTRGIEEMGKELEMLYNSMMLKFEEMYQLVPKMNQTINAMKKVVTEGGGRWHFHAMEKHVQKVESNIRAAQIQFSNLNKFIDNILVEKLHDDECTGSDEFLLQMHKLLIRDPLSLDRKQMMDYFDDIVDQKHSPLHDAIKYSHVKCVKFLLKRGADVTSVTTPEDETVLHTLYESYSSENERLQILKPLLKYGVACMFSHNEAGNLALREATKGLVDEEVLLLLQHGATMTRVETRDAIMRVWENYQLQMLKLILLYCPYQLPSDLCQRLARCCYKKMIVPGVPLDLCFEKFLEALKFYKAFGGKFRVIPWLENQQLLRFLKCYQHAHNFNDVKRRIREVILNPLSLKEISRVAVRKCIGKDYLKNIKKLEVPEDLQPFLQFDDVAIPGWPENFDEFGFE